MNDQQKYKDLLNRLELPEGKSTDEAWDVLSKRLGEARVIEMPRNAWWRYAAAAAVVIGLGVFFFWPTSTSTFAFSTKPGEHQTIQLPDGSVAELNAGSTLAWSGDRDIQLSGEAFFKVKKGSTFTVHTDQGKVEVLGTSFNVLSRVGEFEVVCETGRVAVSTANDRVIITPGKATALINGALVVAEAEVVASQWIGGKFVYQEEPLQNVLAELERQFNVHITSPDVSGRLYSGAFQTGDLNAALNAVCGPMGLKFSVVDAHNVVIELE